MEALRRRLRRAAATVWFAERPKERRWRRAAERGDAQASYTLGMHYVEQYGKYRSGIQVRPVRRLYEAACLYLRQAADSGHGTAALQLARQLARGPKRPRWPEEDQSWSDEAKRYLTAAAESGNAQAAYLLGAMHLRLLRYEKRASDVERYLSQAADANHAKAAHKLGEWLSRQEGRETDAEHFLRIAADRDDPAPPACVDLARLLIRTRRPGEAAPYLHTALNSRFKYYHLDISWMRLLGDVLTETGRATDARVWYGRADSLQAAERMIAELPDFDD